MVVRVREWDGWVDESSPIAALAVLPAESNANLKQMQIFGVGHRSSVIGHQSTIPDCAGNANLSPTGKLVLSDESLT